MFSDWNYIESRDTTRLSQAREQLHHAVQIPAMFARSYSPSHPEDHYGNLGWSPHLKGFVSHLVNDQWQAALILESFKLVLLKDQQTVQEFNLMESSLDRAIGDFKEALGAYGFRGELFSSALPYEIASYQADFGFQGNALEDLRGHLAQLFGNSDLLLTFLSRQYQGVSVQRAWPHHFDLAALFYLENSVQGNERKSIGWGFSPGDVQYREPYYYVNCWPLPKLDHPPDIDYGKWNLEGWIGTVLPYGKFASQSNQQVIIRDYFTSSIEALRKLLHHH